MVLEHLFPEDWLEHKGRYAFLLGVVFSIEERRESMEQRVSLRALWRDDAEVVRIYVFLFLGILLVYAVGTILLPSFQTNNLFREQLEIRFGQGFAGNAVR